MPAQIPRHTLYEGVSAVFTCVLKDEAGAAIAASDLVTLTFTLYSIDSPTDAIINSREAVDILNANGGTVDENGNLTLRLTASDNQILDQVRPNEKHRLRLDWTFASDGVGLSLQDITVQNTRRAV